MSADRDGAPAAPRVLGTPVGQAWFAAAILILLAISMVALHVRTYTLVGPIDELQHIDYLYQSPSLVAPGDRIGQDAMREEACRGLDYPGFPLPACSVAADYDPDDFQEKGYNTASINSPLYYTITHGIGAALQALSGADSLVTTGRLVGGLWLALGLVLTYAVGRQLGAPQVPLLAILVITASMPAVVYPSATITPDAATFAAGAAVIWTLLWWEGSPHRRWPALAGVTAAVLLLKMTNVAVLVAAGLYLLFRLTAAARDRSEGGRPTLRPWLVGAGAVAVTTAVVAVGWLAVQRALTHGDLSDIPMNQQYTTGSLSLGGLIGNLGNWLTPLSSPWASVGHPELTTVLQRLGGLLLTTGIVATALYGTTPSRRRTLAWATLVTAFAGASAFVVVSFVTQQVYIPPPARYGYSLVPAMVAFAAADIRSRTAQLTVVAVAAVAVALSVARLA